MRQSESVPGRGTVTQQTWIRSRQIPPTKPLESRNEDSNTSTKAGTRHEQQSLSGAAPAEKQSLSDVAGLTAAKSPRAPQGLLPRGQKEVVSEKRNLEAAP